MSKFVRVKTELRDAAMIRRALADTKLAWQEDAAYTHAYSRTTVQAPFVVKAQGATFALHLNSDGVYEVLGDDMQMAAIRTEVARLQQRYAYHMVLQEVDKAGFTLVEEQTAADKVIRLTVRRWS